MECGIYFSPCIGSEDSFSVIHRYDRCQFSVGDLQGPIRRAKLNAVTDGQDPLLGTKHVDARRTLRVVLDRSTIIGADGDSSVFGVDGFDRYVSAPRETEFLLPHRYRTTSPTS